MPPEFEQVITCSIERCTLCNSEHFRFRFSWSIGCLPVDGIPMGCHSKSLQLSGWPPVRGIPEGTLRVLVQTNAKGSCKLSAKIYLADLLGRSTWQRSTLADLPATRIDLAPSTNDRCFSAGSDWTFCGSLPRSFSHGCTTVRKLSSEVPVLAQILYYRRSIDAQDAKVVQRLQTLNFKLWGISKPTVLDRNCWNQYTVRFINSL